MPGAHFVSTQCVVAGDIRILVCIDVLRGVGVHSEELQAIPQAPVCDEVAVLLRLLTLTLSYCIAGTFLVRYLY